MPGQAPDCITALLGSGRRAAGTVGDGVGIDFYPFAGQKGPAEVADQDRGSAGVASIREPHHLAGQFPVVERVGHQDQIGASGWEVVLVQDVSADGRDRYAVGGITCQNPQYPPAGNHGIGTAADVGAEHRAEDRQAAANVDGRVAGGAARPDDLHAAAADRRAAGGAARRNGLQAPGIDLGADRRAAGVDVFLTAIVDDGPAPCTARTDAV